MFQTILIAGNLGHDPEMRYLDTGKAFTTFSVGVSDGYGEHRKTLWFKVITYDKLAETCNECLKKGSKVLVEGRLNSDDNGNPRIWNKKDGTPASSFEIKASSVTFLSPKDDVPQTDEA